MKNINGGGVTGVFHRSAKDLAATVMPGWAPGAVSSRRLRYQSNAGSYIVTRAQPGLVQDSAHTDRIEYNFKGSLAGSLNVASGYLDEIASHVQEQFSFQPVPLLDNSHVFHMASSKVFQGSAGSTGTGGQKVQHARVLVSGGLSRWEPATLSDLKALFAAGKLDDLNGLGFNLVPGPVTYTAQEWPCINGPCKWTTLGTITRTKSGFLVYENSGEKITVSWNDTDGKSGEIGACDLHASAKGNMCAKEANFPCSNDDLAAALDSDRDFLVGKAFNQTSISYLTEQGFSLEVMLHSGSGRFDVLPSDPTSVVTLTSSHPDVIVSPTGNVRLRSGSSIASGTEVVITATAPSATVRTTDTCKLVVW